MQRSLGIYSAAASQPAERRVANIADRPLRLGRQISMRLPVARQSTALPMTAFNVRKALAPVQCPV